MSTTFSRARVGLWSAWIIASVFYAYQYVLRVMPNIMLNDILERFQIDVTTFGQFSGVYYIGYSLMHLPVGIMLDRYGPKKVMSGCSLLTVIGLLPLVITDHWVFSIAGRLLIGLGSSAAILGVFKVIRMAFKEEHFSRMLSFSVMIGLIGAIYGGGPVDLMKQSLGYEFIIYLFIGMGVCLTLITYFVVPNTKPMITSTVGSNIKEVLTNTRVLLACLFAGIMVSPLEGFADVWATAFLKQSCGFESSIAASLPSLVFIGMCFGAPLLSFVSERVKNHLLTVTISGICMVMGFVFLLGFPQTSLGSSVNFTIIGICCAYQILVISKVSTYVREQIVGLTTAIANMIIMVFGYFFHTIMGKVVDLMGGVGNAKAITYAIGVVPISLCIGALGFTWLFIQEKRAEKRLGT